MTETSQLLKSIQPLKLVVSPLFLVSFKIKTNGLVTSKCGIFLVFCFVTFALSDKIYIMFVSPRTDFESYFDNYGSLVPMLLCMLSGIVYLVNSGAVVEALLRLAAKSGMIPIKNYNRTIFRVTVLQVVACHALPMSFFGWICQQYMMGALDEVLRLTANASLNYLIMEHYAATSLIFGDAIFFCRLLLADLNKRLSQTAAFGRSKFSGKCFVNSISRATDTEEDLIFIIKAHDWVCQWCVDFNELLGVPLVACCISNLMDMIMYGYYIIRYGAEVWLFLFGFSFCILQNWIVLYACEKFTKEMQRTGVIVNRLVIDTKNQHQKEVLQQFSMSLLHRKVKFTACGLFDLDYKLIYSAMTTVVAYLAIVFQFEFASRPFEKDFNNTKRSW